MKPQPRDIASPEWRPREAAPLGGQIVVAMFGDDDIESASPGGYPSRLTLARWDNINEWWCVCSAHDAKFRGKIYPYFETSTHPFDAMSGWKPLPAIL